MKRRLHCGGPTIELHRWFTRAGASPTFNLPWPQLHDRTVIGTYRGRTAIALACRLLGIGAGDEVLVPAYNCGTELDALLHMGAQLVPYVVSRQGNIATDELSSRRTTRTKAVYIIHYFGWEQPLEELRQWCDAERLLLIEDCALALFSDGPTGAIGRTGDAAIFSLSKTLGFSHGGLLSLPTSRQMAKFHLDPPGFPTLFKEIQSSAKAAAICTLERLGIYGSLLAARRSARGTPKLADGGAEFPWMPSDYYFEPALDMDRSLHSRLQTVAASLDFQEFARRRRANYVQLTGALTGIKGIEPLFPELPAGVCPLSFPLLVSDRDASVAFLQARGIGALPWWRGFHRSAINWSEFPDACSLKRNLLTLPLHQRLDPHHMDYVVESVAQIG